MAKKGQVPTVDILVFFGKRKDLADNLVSILKSLGCNVSILNDILITGTDVAKKLEYYIHKAKFCIVIATADLKGKGGFFPAATLTNELALCLNQRIDDTLILKESGVNLPSTLPNVIYESFPKDAFHRVLPALLKILSARGLIDLGIAKRKVGPSERQNLIAFINEMDALWILHGRVWGQVYQRDHKTESSIAVELDQMFEVYYDGLKAGIGLKAINKSLDIYLEDCIIQAEQHIVNVLKDVLKWKSSEAALEEDSFRKKRKLLYKYNQILTKARTAEDNFNFAKSFSKKREHYENAMEAYELFLKEVGE